MSHRQFRKVGRPPAGVNGDRVVDYPQVSVRMPPNVRDILAAVGEVRGEPHWRVIMEALAVYVRSLPREEQDAIEALMDSNTARQ
jgi:CHAD domain-containing protein